MNRLSRHASASRRGMALIVVMILMVMILIYVIAAQGSVQTSFSTDRVSRDWIDARQLTAAALTQAAAADAPGSATLSWTVGELPPRELQVRYERRSLDAARRAGMDSIPGDVVVLVTQPEQPIKQPRLYLVNTEGRRNGAIALPPAPATTSDSDNEDE